MRKLYSWPLAAVLLCASLGAAAQSYPAKPIRLLLGYPAGATMDIPVRAMAKAASKELGQPIIVENKPGASSAIAIAQMKNAAPDGYTLGVLSLPMYRPPVMQDAGYDPVTDITYIVSLTAVQFGVFVSSDSPWKSFKDLVKHARDNPGQVTYGVTPGLGNRLHLMMEEIGAQENLKWTPLPFKGGPEQVQALLGQHIPVGTDGSGGFANFVDAGKMRLLAIPSEQRHPRWPGVPTIKELGYGITIDSPWGIGGPAGLDPAIVRKVHDAFKKSLDDPDVKRVLFELGQEVRYKGSDEYARYAVKAYAEERALLTRYGLAKKP